MWLKTLKLYNFRCFKELKIEFEPGVNLITGLNAVGKTSILESIYYLGVCKSFKTTLESELINDKNDEMGVFGSLVDDENTLTLRISKDNVGKQVFYEANKIKRISDYLGKMLVVSFSHDDIIRLITGSKNRRSLFEPIICQISNDYLGACNYYKKLLNDRNALLKRLVIEKNNNLLKVLETINEQMFICYKKIYKIRKKFVEKINLEINELHKRITSKNEKIEIRYLHSIEPEKMLTFFEKNLELEIKKGTTLVGPHKDDFEFLINEKNVVDFGSQGQQRNSIISFKLACANLVKIVKNKQPVLLLDDVFSELDHVRQNRLFEVFADDAQVFISSSTIKEIDDEIKEKIKIIRLE